MKIERKNRGRAGAQRGFGERARTGLVLAAGALLRLFYVLGSTIYDRQYDIGMIDLAAGHTVSGGHLAYIQYLYENWRLPDMDPTTVYQFHHPPLHHTICALWMKFCSFFITDLQKLEESIQAVPFLCSLLILLVLLRILRLFALRERTVTWIMAVFAFHPTLILFSGSVNNDCMALLFQLLVIDAAMRWYRKPTVKHIIYIGLAIALGMLTKLTVAQMAIPLSILFLYQLYEKRAQWKTWLFQYLIFGLVSIPLGMSFSVRNLIKYRVPFVWVYTLPEDSWQYVGNYSLWERFFLPSLAEIKDSILHMRIGFGYNVWVQLFRTSVLGEWNMDGVGKAVKLVSLFLIVAGAVLALLAMVGFVKNFVKKNPRILFADRLFFTMTYLIVMGCYLQFAWQFPQQCSMHFRYIPVTLLLPAAGLGFWREESGAGARRLQNVVLAVFVLLSVMMTAVWCGVWG